MPTKADELRHEYARLVSQMRDLNDAAEGEERDFTAEEEMEYSRIEAEATNTRSRIEREQQLRTRELGIESGSIDPRGLNQEDAAAAVDESQAYTKVFNRYLAYGAHGLEAEERALLQKGWRRAAADQTVGSDPTGGYLVPVEFRRQLIEFLEVQSVMRQVPTTKIVTADGRDLLIPRLTDTGAAFQVNEATAVSNSPVTFDQVSMGAYKYGRVVTVSQELLEDAAFDVSSILASKIGGSIGQLEGLHYLTGNGTTQPEGILATSATIMGKQTAAAAAVTTDEIIDLYYSVPPPYARNGVWVFADDALPAVRKLKDSAGRYMLDVAVGSGGIGGNSAIDLLLGKPVYISPDFPGTAFTAAAKIALFGDFSAYWIRDVGVPGPQSDESGGAAFTVRRLDERYAEMGVVGFIAFHRTDGKWLGDDQACKYLVCKIT